ncbi:ATPase, T2SS/T4P/T4SS family [Halodesulfurarchaeum formicicum]|uniref:Type II secretion system protein E n=1 Tax=Halodesulfurarchaeum formicicum TaxID=1873524 RepID=A0A1J1ADK3_9EURY|nr:ATPase, T2SS/T4P/T4SS family [Halodesulfurarchaeum formicicum]APE95981.1 type II secretion system protein E [Halodesulfurarchaeum formicicum]
MFGSSDDAEAACQCVPTTDGSTLQLDATSCPSGGDLVTSGACRRTVVEAISRPIEVIRIQRAGVVRVHKGEAVDLFRAAAQFAGRIGARDERLATRTREDPLDVSAEAAGRAGLVGEAATASGLASYEDDSYEHVLDPIRVPTIASSALDQRPPSDGVLRGSRVLDSGATVRVYDRPHGQPIHHLEPLEYTLGDTALSTLAAARDRLLATAPGTTRDHRAAVEAVAGTDCPIDTLTRVLQKHTAGYGVFEDLFADDRLSEVFVNAPATENSLFVRVDGEERRTNVRLTDRGADRLAAGLRSESGRAFSRASPTIDASLSGIGSADAVRVAGVREPASDGYAFALRVEGTDRWRLHDLVANETLGPAAAGLLSVAMERGGALLIAGPRGAGKTTMASALLWELPAHTRLLAIEDTPELPVRALQDAGRDVQRLEAAADPNAAIDPATALRTALRFGNGALAVGEVRGEEASVLYEAMRVGAASDTVIGTIHGDGYEGVKERVVADLGVPESSFAATDLLVTLKPTADGKRVHTIEEVTDGGSATLYAYDGTQLNETPRLERGNSHFVESISTPGETYAETRRAIETRADALTGSPLTRDSHTSEARADG